MSPLTISEEKMKQVLEQSPAPQFLINGSQFAQISPSAISGTVTVTRTTNSGEAREHLLALFHKIDHSGTVLKTEGELDTQIDEMRRRNL